MTSAREKAEKSLWDILHEAQRDIPVIWTSLANKLYAWRKSSLESKLKRIERLKKDLAEAAEVIQELIGDVSSEMYEHQTKGWASVSMAREFLKKMEGR